MNFPLRGEKKRRSPNKLTCNKNYQDYNKDKVYLIKS